MRESHRSINDSNKGMHGALKQTQGFLVDVNLAEWVEHHNISKGTNPASTNVLQEADRAKREVRVEVQKRRESACQ